MRTPVCTNILAHAHPQAIAKKHFDNLAPAQSHGLGMSWNYCAAFGSKSAA